MDCRPCYARPDLRRDCPVTENSMSQRNCGCLCCRPHGRQFSVLLASTVDTAAQVTVAAHHTAMVSPGLVPDQSIVCPRCPSPRKSNQCASPVLLVHLHCILSQQFLEGLSSWATQPCFVEHDLWHRHGAALDPSGLPALSSLWEQMLHLGPHDPRVNLARVTRQQNTSGILCAQRNSRLFGHRNHAPCAPSARQSFLE